MILTTILAILTAASVMGATPTPTILPVEPTYHGGQVLTAGVEPPEVRDRARMAHIFGQLEKFAAEDAAATGRDVAIQHLTGYMRSAGFLPELVNMAPLMYDLGVQHNVDSRLCVVTITAEASGGRGSYNLFGSLAGACGDLETQVRWYFRRVQEIGVQRGYTGDNWRLAWFWYGGGSSMGGKAEQYADNIVGSVQTIPTGFGGGGSSAQ